ncbi:hypothetical protein ABZ281_22265, partial [Streptomyces sp. NPDC006265]|uniref:hypothetical protein n=1 Tax=Streptomyces sp. NPDC006265 TaxID=3156740 RepID=UPI0033B1692A
LLDFGQNFAGRPVLKPDGTVPPARRSMSHAALPGKGRTGWMAVSVRMVLGSVSATVVAGATPIPLPTGRRRARERP